MSVVPVGCGTFVYYTLLYVKQNAGILTNDASMDITQKYVQIMKSLIFNRLMLAMIAASLVSVIVVYLIRRLSVDYAWIIAIVAGAVAQLAVVFIGDFVFDVSVPILQLLIGTLVSMAIAGIYNFMIFSVDYTRTEYTQFEDDDYYYYVKAVPKACVTTSERSIKKINGSSAKDERPAQDNVVSYANPIFHGDEKAVTTDEAAAPVERKKDIDSVDFEKKLEESLKNL